MASRTTSAAAASQTLRIQHETALMASATDELARITDVLHEGNVAQSRSLDEFVSQVNETAASLKETATRAASVAGSSEQLVSSMNEMAASTEQVNGSAIVLTQAMNEISAAVEETSGATRSVTAKIQDTVASTTQMATSASQMAQSIK